MKDWRPGVNFSNILCAAFARVEPKSVKKELKSSIFLRFWDLRLQKLHINMLLKSTPGVNFINILLAAFTRVGPNSAKRH